MVGEPLPEGYLALTMDQLLVEVRDGSLTQLQRITLKKKHLKRSIQWVGTVRSVQPLWADKDDSEILLIVSPNFQKDKEYTFDLIVVEFHNSHSETLNKLLCGYIVVFHGIIKRFDDYNHLPRLGEGNIIRFYANK